MTERDITQLDRAWAVLSAPSGDQLASFPLDVVFDGTPSRLALDRNGFRHLLIPAADENPGLDTRPAVLSAIIRPLGFGGDIATYLDIACLDRDLHPQFDEVVLDILETIRDAERPVSTAVDSLSRWRRLFRSRLLRGLSMEAKLGLFAELSVLDALVAADASVPIDGWRGPLREPHDFELGNHCLEVKGLAEGSDGIMIHGLDQLDRHDGRPLDLILVTVIPDPDGTTLRDLVGSLRERVESPALLKSRLLSVGWDEQIAIDESDSFTIGAVFGIPITEAVPRLVSAMLTLGRPPEGVVDIRYRVGLAELLPLADETSLQAIAEAAVK